MTTNKKTVLTTVLLLMASILILLGVNSGLNARANEELSVTESDFNVAIAVRVVDEEHPNGGVRFKVRVLKSKFETLMTDGELNDDVSTGVLVTSNAIAKNLDGGLIKANADADGVYDLDTTNFWRAITVDEVDYYESVVAIYNVPAEKSNVKLAVMPYIVNGEVTVYRNKAGVASMADAVLADDENGAAFAEAYIHDYTVTYYDIDGKPIEDGSETKTYGDTIAEAKVDAPEVEGYTFDAWKNAAGTVVWGFGTTKVTGNTKLYAKYTINTYNIVWYDDDGETVLDSQTVEYGQTPVYGGTTPIKADDENYSYVFNTWSPAIGTANSDATYTATYTATELNIISIGEYSATALIGDDIAIPDASIVGKVTGNLVTADGISVSATYNGDVIDVSGGSYQPIEPGSLVITYSASGCFNAVATITVDNKVTLIDEDSLKDSASVYSGVATIGTSAYLEGYINHCIKLDEGEGATKTATVKFYVGDVSAFDHFEMQLWALGMYGSTCYVKTTGGDTLLTSVGWQYYSSTAAVIELSKSLVSDGYLYLTFEEFYGSGDQFYIKYIKGIIAPYFDGIVESSYAGIQINPTANFKIYGSTMATGITATSATFNGETVTLPYTPMTAGTLTLNYEYGEHSQSLDVRILDNVTIVDTNSLASSASVYSGVATIGTSAYLEGYADHCIKLDEGEDATKTATIKFYVGDVSDYAYLEMQLWALGMGGGTCYVKTTGGDTLLTAPNWTYYDNNPAVISLSKSLVDGDGYLWLQLEELYGSGDQFYIKYIKGVIAPYFDGIPATSYAKSQINPSATLKIYGSTLVTGITATSATFNGETVELPYTPTTAGTLTLNYEYGDYSQSLDVIILSEVTLVTKDNLVSNLAVVEGVASIGTAAEALGSEVSYCIKLDKSWTSYTATIKIYVGDVSAFDHLKMEVWIIGINGDTCYVKTTGGDVLFTASGWTNSNAKPAVFDIPTSSVSDGYLYLTLQENWMIGDEFYIQYIKGII